MELLRTINYPAIQINKTVLLCLHLQSSKKAFLFPAGNYFLLIDLLSFPYVRRGTGEKTGPWRCYMVTERCDAAICDILAEFQKCLFLAHLF